MPLSDADKATIREMIRDGISEAEKEGRWLPPDSLVGEKGGTETEYVPTLAKAKEIADGSAKEAIDAYKKDLPKWYEVNRRLDSAGALVAVLIILVGAIYQRVEQDQGGLRNLFHEVADTEAKVRDVLAAEKERWEGDPTFRTVTANALRRWVAEQPTVENPLRLFVKKALEASPVLIFQGQTTFYQFQPINQDCVDFNLQLASALTTPVLPPVEDDRPPSSDYNGTAASIDPTRIPQACYDGAAAALNGPLDVPFFARVYETKEDGPPDQVFAIVVVKREPSRDTGVVSKTVGENGGPAGLCVTYTTQNPYFRIDGIPRESFDLTGAMTQAAPGSSFWEINVSDAIKPYVGSPPHAPFVAQLLHSINVRPITRDAVLVSDDECRDVTSVDDQIISVRVLVFVNKGVINR